MNKNQISVQFGEAVGQAAPKLLDIFVEKTKNVGLDADAIALQEAHLEKIYAKEGLDSVSRKLAVAGAQAALSLLSPIGSLHQRRLADDAKRNIKEGVAAFKELADHGSMGAILGDVAQTAIVTNYRSWKFRKEQPGKLDLVDSLAMAAVYSARRFQKMITEDDFLSDLVAEGKSLIGK